MSPNDQPITAQYLLDLSQGKDHRVPLWPLGRRIEQQAAVDIRYRDGHVIYFVHEGKNGWQAYDFGTLDEYKNTFADPDGTLAAFEQRLKEDPD